MSSRMPDKIEVATGKAGPKYGLELHIGATNPMYFHPPEEYTRTASLKDRELKLTRLINICSMLENKLPQVCPFCGTDYKEAKGSFWHTDDCTFGKMEKILEEFDHG